MDDYTAVAARSTGDDPGEATRIGELQSQFTLIKVKVLLVSLFNGFRDLTLMAFHFNHLTTTRAHLARV